MPPPITLQVSAPPLASSVAASLTQPAKDAVDIGVGFLGTLVEKVLDRLAAGQTEAMRDLRNLIEDLFKKPWSMQPGDREGPPELPAYDQMVDITRTALTQVYPLRSLVPDVQLSNILAMMASTEDQSRSSELSDDAMLLHIVLALGYLCSASTHLEVGCHRARSEGSVRATISMIRADCSQCQTFHACQSNPR